MDKMLNRYFDKVVESEFNQQRMRYEQWRQRRTLFVSYMNLSPAERRRVSVSDMRGYQMQRMDNGSVLLYSFEDNVVYDANIDKQFNKIAVQSVNHQLFDMKKRAMFDNPLGHESVLHLSKHIIYDFYYNVLKTTFYNVELLGQDTDSLIV